MNLLYSVILWPLLGEAAPGYRVLCGSGLYSSHSSSCTGTEGEWQRGHRDVRAAWLSYFSSEDYTFTQQQQENQIKMSKHEFGG